MPRVISRSKQQHDGISSKRHHSGLSSAHTQMKYPDLLVPERPSSKSSIDPPAKHHIIDLSGSALDGSVDDDDLLEQLLDDGSYPDGVEAEGYDGQDDEDHYALRKYSPSVGTSRTVESDLTPGSPLSPPAGHYHGSRWKEEEEEGPPAHEDVEEIVAKVHNEAEFEEEDDGICADEDDEEDEDEDDGSVSSMESEETATLLERAHDRLHLQELHDEIEALKDVIEQKNHELEKLSGQLRRAVATKCDLVLAHNELEMHHEQNLRRRDEGLMQLKKANLNLVEAQSEVEKDLLNEILTMNERIKIMEQKRKTDFEEWDKIHKNELAEKDFKIAKLQEELRKLRYGNGKSSGGGGGGGMISFLKR